MMKRPHRPATTTILVIDDSNDNRLFVRRWLTQAGYRVVEAASGEEGLRVAERQPDLIVLDVQMPDMSGLEVTRRLRSSRTTASIPIVQRSAVAVDSDDIAEGLRSGASLYLAEPITSELLVAAVESLLAVREATRELELVLARDDAGIYEWVIPTGEVAWSPTVQLMHGLNVGDFGGDFESFQQFVEPDERAQVFDAIQAAVGGDGEYSVVYQGRRADGAPIWIRSYGQVFYDTDGQPMKLLGVALDVTDQKTDAIRLAQLHDLAADLNAADSTADVMARLDKEAARHGYRAVLYGQDQAVPPVGATTIRRKSRHSTLDLEPDSPTTVDGRAVAQIRAIAELAKSALRRAWRYDVERENAETLQRALLPAHLPQPPGWSVDSIYVPTSAAHRLGGDFYDAIEIDDRLVMFLGDVAGHGLPAVRTMSEIRTTLRLLALQNPDVNTIVDGARRLSDRLLEQTQLFTTLIAVSLCTRSGAIEVVSSGHLPPLIQSPAGARFLAVDPLPPIGVGSMLGSTGHTISDRLEVGETLVLYSDGVVERRGEELDRSLQRLRSSAAELPQPLTAEAIAFHAEGHLLNSDDRAVLCVRRLP